MAHQGVKRKKGKEEMLLEGKNWVTELAEVYRKKKLKKKDFVEPSFMYHNETCKIWDMGTFYFKFPKEVERQQRGRSGKKRKRNEFDVTQFREKMDRLFLARCSS